MPPQSEGVVLSRIEFVMPKGVLETAYSLSSGLGATFMSRNPNKKTTTQIKLFKRNDESVSISCVVRALGPEQLHQPEHVMIDQIKTKQEPAATGAVISTVSVPDAQNQTLLNIQSPAAEERTTIPARTSPTSTTILAHPTQEIPSSLLAHDDIASPEKTQTTEEKQPSETVEHLSPARRATTPRKSKQPAKELDDKTQDVKKVISEEFLTKSVDKVQENVSPAKSPERRSRRLLRSTLVAVTEADAENAKSPVKKELLQKVKSKLTKDVKSPSETAANVNAEESSPRRPKRTSQLPARLAESEVVMGRKRRISSAEESSTPAKRLQTETITKETAESVESVTSTPTKQRNRRRSRKEDCENTKAKAKSEKTLPCPMCAILLREWENVFDHVKKQHTKHVDYTKHLDELKEKMKTTCHICGKEISRPSAMKMHIETMHTDQAQAQCERCDSVLKSQRHLELHMKRCHLVTKRSHLCHLCPASFKMKAYLVTHLQNVHTGGTEDEIKCDECEKTFSNERYMKTHKLRVHGPKKFSCPHCTMGFSEPSNLRRHIQLIHEAPKQKCHFCPHCDKGFTLKSNLKGHIETIHLKKFPFQCDICMEGFVRRKLLEDHKRASHRAGTCFKIKRELKSSTEQVIEIHQPANVFTIQTVGGNIMSNQAQVMDGSVVHTTEGTTVHTLDGNTIVQHMDVGAIQTIDGVSEQIVEVPSHSSDGSTVAIHVEEGATESDDVQFCIVATPEMLQAFGLQDNK